MGHAMRPLWAPNKVSIWDAGKLVATADQTASFSRGACADCHKIDDFHDVDEGVPAGAWRRDRR